MIILKDWQKRVLKILMKQKYLLLDAKVGMGKGILATYILHNHLPEAGALVLCPPILINDFIGKMEDFYPESVKNINVIDEDNRNYKIGMINITSYTRFNIYDDLLYPMEGALLICDEAHYIKNFKGVTYNNLLDLIDIFEYKLFMSATFISVGDHDLFSCVHLANNEVRELYPTWEMMYHHGLFVVTESYMYKRKIITITGMTKEVGDAFKEEYNIITYKSAGIEEPDIIYKELYYTPEENQLKYFELLKKGKKLSDDALSELIQGMDRTELDFFMQKISAPHSKLFTLSNGFLYKNEPDDPVLDIEYFDTQKRKLVKFLVTQHEKERKGVLFYYFKADLFALKDIFNEKEAYFHDKKRNIRTQIAEFEKGKYKVFIINSITGGVGIRFKKTDYIIHYTKTYNLTAIIQNEGRLIFDGKKDPILIYKISPRDIKLVKSIDDNIKKKLKINEEYRETNARRKALRR